MVKTARLTGAALNHINLHLNGLKNKKETK
jgi:hypothetical protein